MTVLVLILLILGAASFFLAAVGIPSRVNLVAAGLFLWILVPLCQVINSL
jgi:hypothetical protein